jgi:hypothetical protein
MLKTRRNMSFYMKTNIEINFLPIFGSMSHNKMNIQYRLTCRYYRFGIVLLLLVITESFMHARCSRSSRGRVAICLILHRLVLNKPHSRFSNVYALLHILIHFCIITIIQTRIRTPRYRGAGYAYIYL